MEHSAALAHINLLLLQIDPFAQPHSSQLDNK